MTDAFAFSLKAANQLVREPREVPSPGPGEAIIAVAATSVNFHDVIRYRGGYPTFPLPIVPFSDACGSVTAVGEGVTAVRVGDRVMTNFFPNWLSGPISAEARSVIYGDHIDGALQSHLRARADTLVQAPAHLDDTEAATLGCAGLTAWRSVVALGQASPGQVVVVEGTGGVALFALQFARMSGARVIITSSSDEKLERARALGADEVINYRSTPDWGAEVRRLTDGRGADHIIDIGGPDTLPFAVDAAAVGGRISIIGARSDLEREPAFPVRATLRKNLTFAGLSVGSRADLDAMTKAIAHHRMRPVVSEIFAADRVVEAIERMEAQTHFGKIAIRLTDA